MKKSISVFITVLMMIFIAIPIINPVQVSAEEFYDDGGGNSIFDRLWESLRSFTDYNVDTTKGNINNSGQDVKSHVDTSVGTINSRLDKLLAGEEKDPEKPSGTKMLSTLIGITNDSWINVGTMLQSFGSSDGSVDFTIPNSSDPSLDQQYGINYINFVNNYSPIFKTFAYSLAILFFGINIMETAVQYELMTIKGGVKIFGRIIFTKVWIDLSITICQLIIGISNSLVNTILNTASHTIAINMPSISEDLYASSPSIIAGLMDIIWGIIYLLPMAAIAIVIFLVSITIAIKLILRTFDIAMMLSVAPIFFACWVGDTTKQYFNRFIVTFISIVAQLVFMAIVYLVGIDWCHSGAAYSGSISSIENVNTWFSSILPSTIIIVAMGIMMVKPPKILTNLIG